MFHGPWQCKQFASEVWPSCWFQISVDCIYERMDRINSFDQLCHIEGRLFQGQSASPNETVAMGCKKFEWPHHLPCLSICVARLPPCRNSITRNTCDESCRVLKWSQCYASGLVPEEPKISKWSESRQNEKQKRQVSPETSTTISRTSGVCYSTSHHLALHCAHRGPCASCACSGTYLTSGKTWKNKNYQKLLQPLAVLTMAVVCCSCVYWDPSSCTSRHRPARWLRTWHPHVAQVLPHMRGQFRHAKQITVQSMTWNASCNDNMHKIVQDSTHGSPCSNFNGFLQLENAKLVRSAGSKGEQSGIETESNGSQLETELDKQQKQTDNLLTTAGSKPKKELNTSNTKTKISIEGTHLWHQMTKSIQILLVCASGMVKRFSSLSVRMNQHSKLTILGKVVQIRYPIPTSPNVRHRRSPAKASLSSSPVN